MSLAWKNAHRSDASIFLVLASFCAPLPSVSENARNSARIAITSAMRLLKNSPCSPSLAFSIASETSDMMAPLLISHDEFAFRSSPRKRGTRYLHSMLDSLIRGNKRSLSPRVCAAVGFDQPLGVHFRVDLRRCQRGMAEQFLDRADVAAACQQVRGERMSQRVRRCCLGQAERAAQARHRQLDKARGEGATFGADEQRTVERQVIGAKRDV